MPKTLTNFLNEENGQDMVEYSLLVGFMALIGAAVLSGLRNEAVSVWQAISNAFSNAAAS